MSSTLISSVLIFCVVGASCVNLGYIGKLPDQRTRSRPLYIYNGNKTSVAKYPFIASLKHNGTQYASAVILNENWLLTTAWAVNEIPVSELSFRVGSSANDKQGQVLTASKVISHPKYNSDSYDYNIAVVKVSKPIKFGKKVKAITLATKKLKDGAKGLIAGWGLDTDYEIPEYMLEAQVTVLDNKKCAQTYSSDITPRIMCTLDDNVAACPNDYSDPLTVDGVLYALFAGGYDCDPGTAVLYSNVYSFTKWIQSNTKSDQDDK